MSVNSYLASRASSAVLSEEERKSTNTSITTLGVRLDSWFQVDGDKLQSHFRFGSQTRGTILPRRDDQHSDVDYMVVFEKGGRKPQSYLDRLKKFVEGKYSTSEVYQSSPTIVLELNHIKFELVPALHYYGSTYQIPSGPSDWQSTSPNDFNATLEEKNKNNGYLIKPTIRLAKIWNAANGYVFNSYLFEKWVCEQNYWFANNQRDCLFTVFDNLQATDSAAWRNERITRAKRLVTEIRENESQGYPYLAEADAKKLIPE
ncbi:nucleotidyltransferase [Rhizobium ruizarguesonis]|uniref:SMODS domain-containing nucleotidyltransferase n=1 Tax=Rhizobium ruizarguesonis TaxID=2081791 RepID=UPI00102F6116|nr:nucleotidyltransferase [Rhizobium ruizarguesonis]TBD01829.1 nucleotidyltransferase [Rhizobium ruizarguesonis]TBD17975.1 nucleotidyltransferase [Rhizobium ruizarguesonis]TBE99218.1 nucleotidyltransferase [Rhizobium ruizarguesonis]